MRWDSWSSTCVKLKDSLTQVELYSKGAIRKITWDSWDKFCRWLDTLDEDGIQISLKLPCLSVLPHGKTDSQRSNHV